MFLLPALCCKNYIFQLLPCLLGATFSGWDAISRAWSPKKVRRIKYSSQLLGCDFFFQLIEAKGNVTKERERGGSVNTESEIGVMGPQAKECRLPPEARRDRNRLFLLRRAQTFWHLYFIPVFRGTADRNCLPWPDPTATTCKSNLTVGGPGKELGANKLPPTRIIQKRSKGKRRCQPVSLTNVPESSSLESILAERCLHH